MTYNFTRGLITTRSFDSILKIATCTPLLDAVSDEVADGVDLVFVAAAVAGHIVIADDEGEGRDLVTEVVTLQRRG